MYPSQICTQYTKLPHIWVLIWVRSTSGRAENFLGSVVMCLKNFFQTVGVWSYRACLIERGLECQRALVLKQGWKLQCDGMSSHLESWSRLLHIRSSEIIWFWKLCQFCIGLTIPDICHGHHGRCPCKIILTGVKFSRLKAKNYIFYYF